MGSRPSKSRTEIGLGLLGLGVVGTGVYQALTQKASFLAQQVGCPLVIRKVLILHPQKQRLPGVDPSLLTTRAEEVFSDPQVDIVVELIGGERPALDYLRQALSLGKGVVTANKEVMAKHGPELMALAQEKGTAIKYEASVGGGIPLISPFQHDLAMNDISAIYAIINGTTNYILTRMAEEGLDFATALSQAQKRGYAEANPANDVQGLDAAYKLSILASLAFRSPVFPQDIYCQGIERLSSRDFRYARELGYAIKLLAIAKERDGSIEARVHPVFIAHDSLLAQVREAYNAVQVEGDLAGRVVFYGMGAGALPTTSAVLADVLYQAKRIFHHIPSPPWMNWDKRKPVRPISQLITRYYLRVTVADQAGVLAQIARALGERQISIASVIQKEADEAAGTAEIVIMTHPSQEEAMQLALQEMTRLEVVREISNFVRVEA